MSDPIYDSERSEKWPLRSVTVSEFEGGGETYTVGYGGVTAIDWGSTSGHMAELKTVLVYKNGALHSEHPFANVLGVYYAVTP